jgi:selenide,water dikinase
VHPDRIARNHGARVGDRLVLTKALGTGIVATAAKHDRAPADALAAAIASMTTLNAAAATAMSAYAVHACTDVSGFSLLGHGYEMASASGVTLRFTAAALPVLPGARVLAASGELTGGCGRNRRYLADKVRVEPALAADLVEVAFDPQTSGGLLIALAAGDAERLVDALRAAGVEAATIVGEAVAADAAAVALV